MNTIIKDILFLLTGILLPVIIYFVVTKLINKKSSTSETKTDCAAPNNTTECFDAKKALNGLLSVNNAVLWMKDISGIFNLRKLIIIGIIVGLVWGYGYYKGKINKPVQIAVNVEVEFTIPVPNSPLALHHGKNSTTLEWINLDTGRVVATVKVKDIPQLKKILKPYKFQLKPFITAGGSLGNKAEFEAGAGIDFFKYFKWNANIFATNLAAYLGVGYQITDNFDIMLGYGKGWKQGDNRIGIFGKWKF